MSQINRPPIGLQSLLGSKNFGDNPAELDRSVQPVLDILPFYAGQTMRTARGVGGRIGPGTACSVLVDDGELWILLGLSMRLANITGGPSTHSLQGSFNLRGLPGDSPTVPHFIKTDIAQSVASTEEYCFACMMDQPILLEPTTTIEAFWVQNDLNNADSVTLTALYYALEL